MALQYIGGFEVGDLSREIHTGSSGPTSTGSVALESSIVRSGNYSLKATPASGAAGHWNPGTATGAFTSAFFRFYVRITVLPGTARMLCGSSATAFDLNVLLNPSGTISLRMGTTVSGTSSATLADTSRWYRIEVKATNGAQELRLDGVSVATDTVASASVEFVSSFGATDTVAATYTAYYDDIVGDNAAYPADGKVVMLLPVSDNTVTNWTGGAGGVSSLFDAVNNLPPAGLASASETNTSNIESASGSGTAAYIANMGAYSDAVSSGGGGLRGTDTVNIVRPCIRHGEDSGTGTKNGTFELTGNPVIGTTSFLFGDDAGAHLAELNLWKGTFGLVATAPSVTIGSNPTMKVVKTDTGTRTACIDFMGIYVDYTPAPSFVLRPRHRNYIIR